MIGGRVGGVRNGLTEGGFGEFLDGELLAEPDERANFVTTTDAPLRGTVTRVPDTLHARTVP